MLLSEDLSKLQYIIDLLNGSVGIFRFFSPLKFKTPLQDWIGSKSNFFVAGARMGEVNVPIYLGNRISPGYQKSHDTFPSKQNVRFSFSNLRHLWYQHDIRLSLLLRVPSFLLVLSSVSNRLSLFAFSTHNAVIHNMVDTRNGSLPHSVLNGFQSGY